MDKLLLRYVNSQGPLPAIAGTKSGSLLIIGSAAGVWDDLKRYDEIHGDQDRMGINYMMLHYPGVLNHGVTLHTDHMPMWGFLQAYRHSKQGGPPMVTHSHQKQDWVKYVWPIHRDGGVSGLFGVLIGLLMGYERIILAGCPCDRSPHFYAPPWGENEDHGLESRLDEWFMARDEIPLFKERVRSLSGRTREVLGEP